MLGHTVLFNVGMATRQKKENSQFLSGKLHLRLIL